ncbi:MAG: ParB/RepB/Spo0J family partition protein [Bauldia sp.]|nr:ParB/RepB/Spo0J family partition protein [Bauldia sp.]
MAEEAARSRLGRGLAALIGDVKTETAGDRAARTPRRLPVAYLRPNPSNPRKAFGEADLADLTASIRERGVVQPLIVRLVAGASDAYEIVAGERRWRAAQKAGLHDVPVIVREASDKEALELAIIENVQRADLNPLEEAKGYQQLIDQYNYSQNELADVIGKSRSHIANTLRLLNLPEAVQVYILDGRLTAGHARALLTLDDPLAAARRILNEGMSVRDVEAIGAGGGRRRGAGGRKRQEKDADTRALEKSLSDLLGLAVTIEHKNGRGEVRIRYTSLEQLDDVCRRLRGR